jgi:gliding motility-associated-like protein
MLNEKPFSNNNSLVFSNDTLKHGDLVYCLVQPGSGAANTTPIASNKISLVINALPVVDVFPADTIIRVGNTVVFRVFVAGNVDNGEWTPANKMKDIQLPAPSTVTLYETTAYTLKVKTNKGCEAFSDAQVQVTKPMVMPTGFTPNGDGANDVFRIPPGIIFELKEFSVYDRWGAQLFFTRNRKNGWDGTFRGKQACPGEYVYMVSAKNDKGSFILKGKVTLLR